MKYFIGLFIVILFSFLSICTYDLYPKVEYEDSLDSLKLIAPGVIFSLFVISFQINRSSIKVIILFFVGLLLMYIITVGVAFSCYGLSVPITGGLGGGLVKIVSNYKGKIFTPVFKKFFWLGFLSSLVGLLFFFFVGDKLREGITFGIMIICWQIIIGVEYIIQVKYLQDEN